MFAVVGICRAVVFRRSEALKGLKHVLNASLNANENISWPDTFEPADETSNETCLNINYLSSNKVKL